MSKAKMATQQDETDGNDRRDFQDFGEYWHYAKYLSIPQRQVLYASLSKACRKRLEQSCERGGWLDVIKRDEIDAIVNDFQDQYSVNFIDLRVRVLKGKSVYLPRKLWENINAALEKYETRHKEYVIGGIRHSICKENENVVLLLPANVAED